MRLWRLSRGTIKMLPKAPFTGNCPIREHTGDGAYVGRCDSATYDGVCPRHGRLTDYPDNDDRAVDPQDRCFVAAVEGDDT